MAEADAPALPATKIVSHPPSLQCTFGAGSDTFAMNPLLQQLEDELSLSLHGLNATQAQFHPHGDQARWSIWQITQHLLLTYSSTASSLESRLAKGTPTRSRPTLPQSLAQICVIRFGILPGRREVPPIVAPSACPPVPAPDGEGLISAVTAGLTHMDALLDQAEGTFSSAPCLSHFALGPLSIPQWRRFHRIHGRHHARQIIAIRREYGI